MIKNFDELIDVVKNSRRSTIAVAAAEDMDVIQIVQQCQALADFILIGNKDRIESLIKETGQPFKGKIVDVEDHAEAARKAVELVKTGAAGNLMKGLLHTGVFLKAILNKETGLNKGRLVSEVTVYEKDDGSGLQMLTDCAINPAPDLMQKKEIIENAVELARKLGYELPRVAAIAAVELVNPDMPATIDAAALTVMSQRGQIKNAIVDGPLAFDNAVDLNAARHKGISGPVAGNADILLAPYLEVGNALSKSLTFWVKKRKAAALIGVGTPVIMTSRSESLENKVLTVALSAYIATRQMA
jgi:phosphate butyryltransferase